MSNNQIKYFIQEQQTEVSETSFGSKSTEMTQTKLQQPEAKVQRLQYQFVRTIIGKLWQGEIVVS